MATFVKGLFSNKGIATTAAEGLLKNPTSKDKDQLSELEKGEGDGANEEQTQEVECDIRCCDSPSPRTKKILKQ